jgi:ABC-type Na+ efflux pump permease subunit
MDPSAIEDLFDWIPADGFALEDVQAETEAFQQGERITEVEAVLIPLGMQMMMLLMLMMGAMPLLAAVTEEKAQRIAEVVLGSVTPFEFMFGKVLGGVGVSLTASLVYLAGGAWAVRQWEVADLIPLHVIPWFLAFMVLAVVMLGAMMAALGSACADATEAQSLQFPAVLPIMIPILLAVPVAQNPSTGFATGLSLFPLFTPLLMILRHSTPGGVPLWQVWIGLGGVAAFSVLFIWLGGRVFRVAILMQGTPPRIKHILRWAVRG